MKTRILIFACIMAAAACAASRTATEAFVTNRVTLATNALHQSIAPSIDYTTNNVELTNTIAKVAPSPGNYGVVSNAAMHAVQNKQGRIRIENNPRISWDAYDVRYFHLATDRRGWEFVYDDFGSLFLPIKFGDHTVATLSDLAEVSSDIAEVASVTNDFLRTSGGTMTGNLRISSTLGFYYGQFDGPTVYAYTPVALAFGSRYSDYANRYAILDIERIPEYATADIAFLHEVPTSEDITAAIREQSLGGIWDEQLGVWWTPVMSNGKLTYQATTNVNMSAETNP